MVNPYCVDCGVDVYKIHEYAYVVYSHVWLDAGFKYPSIGNHDGLCCIGCLEMRLGRKLHNGDFDLSIPINNGGPFAIRQYFDNPKSPRLMDRYFNSH